MEKTMTQEHSQGAATAEALNQFIIGASSPTIPDAVVERVKRSILDVIGCAAYGTTHESIGPVVQYVSDKMGGTDSTVWFGAGKASATGAATANGTAVH